MSAKLSYTPTIQKAINELRIHEHAKQHKCSTCLNAVWQISSLNFPNSGTPEDARDTRADPTPLRCYCNATHSYVHLGWFVYDTNTNGLKDSNHPAYMTVCDGYDPLTVPEK